MAGSFIQMQYYSVLKRSTDICQRKDSFVLEISQVPLQVYKSKHYF